MHELTAFPKGKHDEQVDSTAKRAGGGPSSNAGIRHLYKAQYEAQQTASQTAKLPPWSRKPKDLVIGFRKNSARNNVIENPILPRCPNSQPSEDWIVKLPPCCEFTQRSGFVVLHETAGGQRVVRPHPLQPAE